MTVAARATWTLSGSTGAGPEPVLDAAAPSGARWVPSEPNDPSRGDAPAH